MILRKIGKRHSEIFFEARYLKKHLASGLGRSDKGSLAVITDAT